MASKTLKGKQARENYWDKYDLQIRYAPKAHPNCQLLIALLGELSKSRLFFQTNIRL